MRCYFQAPKVRVPFGRSAKIMKLSLFSLAKRNMRRRVFRTVVVLVGVGVATGTLFTATILLWGLENGIREGRESLGADLFLTAFDEEIESWTLITGQQRTATPLEKIVNVNSLIKQDLEAQLVKVEGVEAVTPQLYLSTWKDPKGEHCTITDARLIGYDPQTDFVIKPLLENKLERPVANDEMVAGNNMVPFLEYGERVFPWLVYGSKFSVVGRLKKTGTILDFAQFIPMGGVYRVVANAREFAGPDAVKSLERIKPGFVSSFLIKIDPRYKPSEVMGNIRTVLPPGPILTSTADTVTTLGRRLSGTLTNLVHLGLALWGMSILVVGTIFSTIVNERRREIGLLRAMGATSLSIFKLIIFESGMLTALAGLVGVGIGSGAVYYFHSVIKSMNLPYAGPTGDYLLTMGLICVAAGIIAGLVGALYPAIRSSRMEPLSAIRLGE